MARLFVGPREQAFIDDITRELVKDVVGQRLFYYAVSVDKTRVHPVYDEAIDKVFDPPVELDARVGQPEYAQAGDAFSIDRTAKLEAYVQWRDLVDKGIEVSVGDFFTYGDVTYEVVTVLPMRRIYGQVEHTDGVKISGITARQSMLRVRPHGPTDIARTDADAVQETFVQQRGLRENSQGPTNDRRELVQNGTLEPPLTGAREVSRRSARGPAFYDE